MDGSKAATSGNNEMLAATKRQRKITIVKKEKAVKEEVEVEGVQKIRKTTYVLDGSRKLQNKSPKTPKAAKELSDNLQRQLMIDIEMSKCRVPPKQKLYQSM